jgi:hypothetical protein
MGLDIRGRKEGLTGSNFRLVILLGGVHVLPRGGERTCRCRDEV